MVFCKHVQERSTLDLTKLCSFFYLLLIEGNKTLAMKINGEVLEEINPTEKSFLPFKALCMYVGQLPHFIDLKR